jgi:polyphosphate glucokinase
MSAQRRNERADSATTRAGRSTAASSRRPGQAAKPAVRATSGTRAKRTPRAVAGAARGGVSTRGARAAAASRAAAGGAAVRGRPPAAGTRVARPGGRVTRGLARPTTLSFDIGGTGLKASVLDAEGKMLADRVRVATTYPCPPAAMVDKLVTLAAPLPSYDRVSAGFPGVVRNGKVLTAPHFVTTKGPGSSVSKELLAAWTGFDLAGELEQRLHKPTRVANDADLQGWEVVSGKGLELVVTLGTGVGTGLFLDGKLCPHLEISQHPMRKGETYNEQIGNAALQRIGPAKWRRRVHDAIRNLTSLVNYDRLYLGGGNARLMAGHVDESVTIIDNLAGILGGIKLWEDGI